MLQAEVHLRLHTAAFFLFVVFSTTLPDLHEAQSCRERGDVWAAAKGDVLKIHAALLFNNTSPSNQLVCVYLSACVCE